MGFDFNQFGGDEQNGTKDSGTSGKYLDGDYGDYDYAPRLYMTPQAIIRGNMHSINTFDTDFGTTVVANLQNTRLEHGLAFRKEPKSGDTHRKLKLWSFGEFDREAQAGPDFDFGYIPPTKDVNVFGNEHRYVFLGGRIANDDTWETVVEHSQSAEDLAQFEDSHGINAAEEVASGTINIGDARWYFDAKDPQEDDDGNDIPGTGGPSSASKRFVKLMTQGGESNLVPDKMDSKSGWVRTEGLTLKPEHEGRDVRMFMVERPGDEHQYQHLYIQDVETGHMLEVNGSTETTNTGNVDVDVEMEEQPSVEVSDTTARVLKALAENNDESVYEQVVVAAIENDDVPLTENDLNGADHATVAAAMKAGSL